MKIKAVYLLPEMKLGGAERHVLSLAKAMRDRGHDARIVCIFKEGVLAEEVRKQKIPFRCLGANYRWDLSTFRKIASWLSSEKIDVLHTYLFGFHFFAGLSAKFCKVPVVLSTRRELPYWQKRRHLFLENIANLFAERVICCSDAVKEWTLKKEKVRAGKVMTIYNAVDNDRLKELSDPASVRKELDIPKEAFLIGTVASLVYEKGYPFLIKAAEEVTAKRPDAVFLIVGGGKLEKELKERAADLIKNKRMIFTGPRADVPSLIQSMDLFVLASEWEGFPNVLLEAMALSRAVIATRVGGIPELVESEESGLLVPPGDPVPLAQAIIRLIEDDSLRQQLSAAARERIEKKFLLSRMIDEYENLYADLLIKKKIHPDPPESPNREKKIAVLAEN